MRRGVVAGLRVHGQQKADRDYVEQEEGAAGGAAVKAGVVEGVAKHEARALVMIGHEDEQRDDREYA